MSATATVTGLVLNLDRIDASMPAAVGGKATNLGEMIRAGLPVPPGVCVTTEAYRMVVAESALDAALTALESVAADDVPALTALAGQARAALLATPVPPAVTAAVTAAHSASLRPLPPRGIPSASAAATYLRTVALV